MRNIWKHAEPKSLQEHRCKSYADYANYSNKDDLRKSLVTEQRGICCYCMRRIRPKKGEMKIEHWQSQSPNKYPEKQLSYGNLLGACIGGLCRQCAEGTCEIKEKHNDKRKLHCDSRKDDDDLSFNPANPYHDVESKLKYLGDGRIDSEDGQFKKEIDEILNLNTESLVNARKAVIDSFRQVLIQKKPSNADLMKELRKWNGDDDGEDLRPYCQVVVYYLRKKVARMK